VNVVKQTVKPWSSLVTLPLPPKGRFGWPWTEQTLPLPSTLPEDKPWPRISVVTPSLNQAAFLEQTIRSVLLQNYPSLDYIIIDGESADGSIQIIQKYAPYLSHWVTEPDRGQGHAINKGFRIATGEIMGWVNSDDYYLPGTLYAVAEQLHKGTGNYAIVGHHRIEYIDGRPPRDLRGRYEDRRRLLQVWKRYEMHQPSIFWRREVFEETGLLNEELYRTMDFDYWARISKSFAFLNCDRILSCATFHPEAKSGDGWVKYHQELRATARRYWGSPRTLFYWQMNALMIADLYVLPQIRNFVQSVRRRGNWILGQLGRL
jgi:glycosyltransferase involved in cell wall biosynthesis